MAGRRALLAFTLVGVAASTALLWWLFDGIDQYGDVTGVYFRTDARAAALLLGSALALVWQPAANENQVEVDRHRLLGLSMPPVRQHSHSSC